MPRKEQRPARSSPGSVASRRRRQLSGAAALFLGGVGWRVAERCFLRRPLKAGGQVLAQSAEQAGPAAPAGGRPRAEAGRRAGPEQPRGWPGWLEPGAKPGPGAGAREAPEWRAQAAVLALVAGAASLLLLAGSYVVSTPSREQAQERVFEKWYARAAEASKKATKIAQKELMKVAPKPSTGPALVPASVVERIRGMSQILDTCQQDIYNEVWIGLQTYADILRGHLPLMSYYTETAYPLSPRAPEVGQVRNALKYEAGRLSRGVAAFESGVAAHNIRDIEKAFADMSLAYDRYLKAGNLYEGYDPVTSTTVFYDGIDDRQLVYTPITLEQPRIRDEVLVIQGPDKGKIGQVIWLGRNGPGYEDPDRVVTATVKMSPNPTLGGNTGRGVAEVKTYPYSWIAVQRTSQQSFQLDLLLGSLAAIFSCTLTYPLDSLKARIQSGLPVLPPEGPAGLFNGLAFNLLKEVPNQGFYMAGFNFLTRQFCLLPFIDSNSPSQKLLVMIPAGILGFVSGSPIRAPFEIMNRQLQTGEAKTEEEAIQNLLFKTPPQQVWQNLQTTWVLLVVRGVPFGALQCTFYELFKDRLELIQYGVPISFEPFIWGALAGALTGVITNPPDVVLARFTKLDKQLGGAKGKGHLNGARGQEQAGGLGKILEDLAGVTAEINAEEGIAGFFRGASARALYFAPEACLWFAAYEYLRQVAAVLSEL